MRDDLHKTVPVSRAWRRVLRLAYRDEDIELMPQAITSAANSAVQEGLRKPCAKSFKESLEQAAPDLFGIEHQAEVIQLYRASGQSPVERKLCEVALGLHAKDGAAPDIFEAALRQCVKANATDNIELIKAHVRKIAALKKPINSIVECQLISHN